jgi:hypothetical protein
MKKYLLPPAGSLQRRVLDALYLYRAGSAENDLMAAHGMDGMAPTMWRQGPYRALLLAGLIEPTLSGFNNSRRWILTAPCRTLMQAERAQPPRADGPTPAPSQLVPARQAPDFVALDPGYYSRIPQRDGAWDFKNIPSLYADQGASPKCA